MKIKQHIPLIAILVLTIIAFIPTFEAEFLNWDDTYYIVLNDLVKQPSYHKLIELFTPTTYVMGNYHPITILSYWVDEFFGGSSFTYHCINLCLHLINSVLLYFVLQRLKLNWFVVVFTSLLFAIHPTRVETVVWISDRKDILALLFMLLTAYTLIKHHRLSSKYLYVLGFLSFTLALLSKIIAVCLLLFIGVYVLFFEKNNRIKNIVKLLPFGVVSVLILFFNVKAQQAQLASDTVQFTSVSSFLIPFKALCLYVFNLFWPFSLTVLYTNFTAVLMASFLLIVLIVFSLFWGERNSKLGLIWCFVFLLPVLQIFSVGNALGADRYTYIAYIGLFITISTIINALLESKGFKFFVLGLMALLVIPTHLYALKWSNSVSLWSHQIHKFPNHALALVNRGEAYKKVGQFTLALNDYNTAWRVAKHKTALLNKAIILEEVNNNKAAIETLNILLNEYPYYDVALNNRALLFKKEKRYYEALEDLNTCLRVSSNYAEAYVNRANLQALFKQYKSMQADAEKAISINPYSIEAYTALGNSLAYQKKYTKAIGAYNEGLQLRPDYNPILVNKKRVSDILKSDWD